MEYLKNNCVHFLLNATSSVNMGLVDVNERNSLLFTPPDLLHTFMCGLFKNVTLWIITIISQISKSKDFIFSQNMFDARISSFKDICKVSNVTISYFRKGICYLSKNKTKKEKSYSTGGAGGLRSCEFVCIVLQMFFAIGLDGKILPNTPRYIINRDYVVGNITEMVLIAITTLLDAYFSIQMSPVTRDRIQLIKFKIQKMSKHFIILYQLMLKFCEQEEIDLPHSRKLHAVICSVIPFLTYFGTFLKADTSSYESVHRVMTVGVWKKTSKRYDSMNREMAKQALLQNYYYTNEFLSAISNNRITDYIMKFGPYIAPSTVIVKNTNNYKSFNIQIDENDLFFCEDINIASMLFGSSLTVETVSNYMKEKLGLENWNALKINDNSYVNIIQCISLEGNKNSKVGKIILYATNAFKNKRRRYSYVSVQITDSNQPAQLLCLLEYISGEDNVPTYFAIIRYLMPVRSSDPTFSKILNSIDSPFKLYEWEWNYIINRSRRVKGPFLTSIIEVETIVGAAFIIPVYKKTSTIPNSHNPKYEDRFWYADQQFFDRSGWDDVRLQEEILENTDDNDDINDIHIPHLDNLDLNTNNDIDSNSDEYDSNDNDSI